MTSPAASSQEKPMQADQFRSALRAKPFRAFDVHTGSGESYRISHPEGVLVSDSGRTIVTLVDGEFPAIIDMESVTEVIIGRPGRTKKPSKP
jgi:hypothetical protein